MKSERIRELNSKAGKIIATLTAFLSVADYSTGRRSFMTAKMENQTFNGVLESIIEYLITNPTQLHLQYLPSRFQTNLEKIMFLLQEITKIHSILVGE